MRVNKTNRLLMRRRWDSNPRGFLRPASLAVRCFRPLSHVSRRALEGIGARIVLHFRRVFQLVGYGEQENVLSAFGTKRACDVEKRRACRGDVVDDYIYRSGIERRRSGEAPSDVLSPVAPAERRLGEGRAGTNEQVRTYRDSVAALRGSGSDDTFGLVIPALPLPVA